MKKISQGWFFITALHETHGAIILYNCFLELYSKNNLNIDSILKIFRVPFPNGLLVFNECSCQQGNDIL